MPHPRFAMYVKYIVHTYAQELFSSGCRSYKRDSNRKLEQLKKHKVLKVLIRLLNLIKTENCSNHKPANGLEGI